jgi:hypothetical protein
MVKAYYKYMYCYLLAVFPLVVTAYAWIQYPSDGFATMTHYSLPINAVVACGCTPGSTHYPTAALNQMAYGSSAVFGPACGKCFNLTLLNTFLSNPRFYPDVVKSVVVKVTDLCPLSLTGWCNATEEGHNAFVRSVLWADGLTDVVFRAGHDLNFDLAWPSSAIPNDFFPSNVSFYVSPPPLSITHTHNSL